MHVARDRDLVALLLELRHDVAYLLCLDLADLADGLELVQEVVLLDQQQFQLLLRGLRRGPVVLREPPDLLQVALYLLYLLLRDCHHRIHFERVFHQLAQCLLLHWRGIFGLKKTHMVQALPPRVFLTPGCCAPRSCVSLVRCCTGSNIWSARSP